MYSTLPDHGIMMYSLVPAAEQNRYVETFERMQNVVREQNIFAEGAAKTTPELASEDSMMTEEQLRTELQRREQLMQKLHDEEGVETDQWRVYREVISALDINKAPLRLFLQASAGTGQQG